MDIRWLIRRDMPQVMEIESFSQSPWTQEQILDALRQRYCVGMVCECSESHRVIGFMIYELHKSKLIVLNVAVHPQRRRQGVGMSLLNRLMDKLSRERRKEVTLHCRESNLPMQCLCRSVGMRCVEIIPGFYDDEDAYLMSYRISGEYDLHGRWSPANRISQFIE